MRTAYEERNLSVFASLRSQYSYAVGLKRYLREPLSLEEAHARVGQQLAYRDRSFLRILEHTIYANAEGPYFKLLQHAGIDFEDVHQLVDDVGLEGALERLYDAGVYVTQDEFKGRQPIKRGELSFETSAAEFDNPLVKPVGEKRTSGSTGQPTRIPFDFQYMEYKSAFSLLTRVEQARKYPQVSALRELRHSLSEMKLEKLAVGVDGRNRCLL